MKTSNGIDAVSVNALMRYTTFTSHRPEVLTKIIRLQSDGSIEKKSAASMHSGTAERTAVQCLEELARNLDRLDSSQAVGWGVARPERAAIVTEKEAQEQPGALTRTRQHFTFAPGPGVMMLDHDGVPEGALGAEALRDRLIAACPALADAPMLWRPSSSAGLRDREGREITPLTRHRLYIPVRDASLIPEAGKAIVLHLWAAGAGWYEVGRAGQALERTLVDASVWQPERLDFAAPPILHDGLQRPAAPHRIFGDPRARFDLARIPRTDDVAKQARINKKKQRALVSGRCQTQRDIWATDAAPALAKRRAIPVEKAREVLRRASADCVLMGDFVLLSECGKAVSVGQILDAPNHWHNTRFADPLDPDADMRVAVVNLKSGMRPALFTHRHGGLRFELLRQSARIQVGRGMRTATTDAVLSVLQDRGELYEYGDNAMVYVAGGKVRPVSQDWLTDAMGRWCEFYSVARRRRADGEEATEERPEDAPSDVVRAVLAKHGERGLKQLNAVVTAPTLRADGTILDRPGHDESSGLLYYSENPNPPRIPSAPSVQDALEALRVLWQPVALFPVVDALGNAVVLHGLLSAALRASLPTAPGVAFDAPAAGSGKTLLARCIGILATGAEPAILPPADTEEESRKRLFTVLREGQRVVLWDNVHAELGGAALDSFLTAPTFCDRVLGSSESVTLPNRALFIATGNNLRLKADTCRRVLTARIDAESEQPYARDFSFDPAQLLLRDRLHYVVAALTIVRAYITAGRPKVASGRAASFENWDALVRQPICWLAEQVAAARDAPLPALDDPLKAAERAYEHDPETSKRRAMLEAWAGVFGSSQASVADAVRACDRDALLSSAVDEIAGHGGKINARQLGNWIGRAAGSIVAGRRFVRVGLRAGVLHWAVDTIRPDNAQRAHTAQPIAETEYADVAVF